MDCGFQFCEVPLIHICLLQGPLGKMTFIKHDGFEEIFILFYFLEEKAKGFEGGLPFCTLKYRQARGYWSTSSGQHKEREKSFKLLCEGLQHVFYIACIF